MMSTSNVKSPISYLFEQCVKRNLTLQFEEENFEGPVHQRIFTFKVTAGEFVGKGSASSKKKAKHFAASEVLNQMTGVISADNSNEETSSSLSKPNELNKEMPPNPIGQLQELTQKRLLPLPTYEFEMHPGPPTVREFTCTVHLLKLTETGVGRSKKMSKRIAAQAMLDQLQGDGLSSQLDEALKSLTNEFSVPQSDIRSAYQALKEGKKTSSLRSTQGLIMKTTKLIPSYCDLLQELADERKFEVTYVDLSEPTMSGLNQCVVQLSTMPVIVCHGNGRSIEESHSCAAKHSILYFETFVNDRSSI